MTCSFSCNAIIKSLCIFCSFFILVHVIFDDAFELNDDVDKFVPNSFVKQLMECMEDAARYVVKPVTKHKEKNNHYTCCVANLQNQGGNVMFNLVSCTDNRMKRS